MNTRKIQFIMSIAFVSGYFILLAMIIYIEASDSVNMKKGDNSMMGEFKILLGVMTGAVAQILNFWFNKADLPSGSNDSSTTSANLQPIAPATTPVAVATPIVPVEEAS